MSKVPNVSYPSFSDQEVLDIIQNAGYTKYFTDKYTRTNTGTGIEQGYHGFWTKQVAGPGVEHPIIFYNELYPFTEGENVDSLLVSWRYDTNDNLIEDPCVTQFEGIRPRNLMNTIRNGAQLNNGYNVIGEFNSYDKAKQSVQDDIKLLHKNINNV